jgi:hypothetical protein
VAQLPSDADIPVGGGEFVTDRTISGLAGAPAPLTDATGGIGGSGSTTDAATIYLASEASDHWQLTRDGQAVAREDALGWANQYQVDAGGSLELTYSTPPLRAGWLARQALLWVLCFWYLWHSRVAKEDARDRARLRTAVDL